MVQLVYMQNARRKHFCYGKKIHGIRLAIIGRIKMLTKKYKNGFVTLDAEKFPSVAQETIDREIRNFEPVKKAVEKLYEHERRDIPMKITIDEEYGLSHCPNCGDSKHILFGDKLCVECGQALDWSATGRVKATEN